MKKYRNKEQYITRRINDYKVFILFDICFNTESFGIDYIQSCFADWYIYYLLQKGRIFLSKEEAVARHEEIRSLLLPYNDDRIYDKENGRLLIDPTDESIRKIYNIEIDEEGTPEFWTITLSDDDCSKTGFKVEKLYYNYNNSGFIYVEWNGEEYDFEPAILFATQRDAMSALERVEPLLQEQPHSLFYWMDDYYLNMGNGYFCRESSRNLPKLLWDTYFPNHPHYDSKIFSEMRSVLDSDEGLYKKSNSKYDIELVMRTDGTELNFRDNTVLINDEWLPISVLFPMIGIHTQSDLYRAFGIETEKVVLNKDNYKDYIGRILALPVENVYIESFVNEVTGEVEEYEVHDIALHQNTPLPEYSYWSFERSYCASQEVLLLKNNDDKLATYLLDIPFFGHDIENDALYGGVNIHNQWEAAVNAFQYMATHTRLTHTGRMRLDKALYESKENRISKIIKDSEREYTFASSQCDSRDFVTPSDFIEIIKLLAYKGEGYKTMTDNPAYYPNGELDESILKEVINRRKADIPEWQQEAKVVNECFEIDYALHCEEPLV